MSDRNFAGGATSTQLNGGISDSATSFTVDDGSTFPTSNFTIVIGRGTASEEKVLVGTRTSNTFSSCTRGYDGSSASAHADNTVVEQTITAEWLNDINDNSPGVKMTTTGDMLYASAANTASRLAIGSAGDHLEVVGGVPAWRNRLMGYAQVTANQTGITAITDLTGLTVTFTAVAGRRYKATAHVRVQGASDVTEIILSLREGSTTLQQHYCAGVNSRTDSLALSYVNNSSISGSKTWKLSLESTVNVVSLQAASTYPAFILVEDIGPL